LLGRTGLSVSILTFGGITVKGLSARDAEALVSEAVERGVNYFDTSPIYDGSQAILGPALAPHRKRVYLACKTNLHTAKEARAELEHSLRELRTDYFDVFQLHQMDERGKIERVFAPGGAFETLRWAKESGVARCVGFTSHIDDSALLTMEHADFDTMMFPVNYVNHLYGRVGVRALAACKEKNMGVVAIKAMANRNWRPGEPETAPTWYRPHYDDPAMARLALNYTLTRDVSTASPPGLPDLFRLALGFIEEQGGDCAALSADETETLRASAEGVRYIHFR
jgi:aryl-alcohol dehydrogenase-like predicted oxidoreductase